MSRFLFVWFIPLLCQMTYGQVVTEREIHGKISSQGNPVQGIEVVNLMSEKSAVSNADGQFSIMAKVADVVAFSSPKYEYQKNFLQQADIDKNSLNIEMRAAIIELDDVVIQWYDHINAVALGIISKNQKSYTPAERKLRTAGDFKPIMLLNLIGGSMPLDPLLNKINGRTKRLKKEVVLEKKELNLKYLAVLFEEDYFVSQLKIPLSYVKGFQYYSVENEKFTLILATKNKVSIEFLLAELAVKYNEIIACENE
jgi:hypothetical protein